MNPNIEENKIKEKLSEIILRAWQEPSFKQKLIETPQILYVMNMEFELKEMQLLFFI